MTGSLFNCNNPGNICANGFPCDFTTGRCMCSSSDQFTGDRCHRRIPDSSCVLNCGQYGSCAINAATGTQVCVCDTGYNGAACQIAPYTCSCTSSSMQAVVTLPGDFSNGRGYETQHRGVSRCGTSPTVGNPNQHAINLDHNDAFCGQAERNDDFQDGSYVVSRVFTYRYIDIPINNIHDIYFQCTCSFDRSNTIFTSIGNVNTSPGSNPAVIFREATSYMAPISYRFTDVTGRSISGTTVDIGQKLILSITADAGYCVIIDEIVSNNSMSFPDNENVVLMSGRCQSDIGRSVIGNEIEHDVRYATWDISIYAFAFDKGNSVQFAIRYRAESDPNVCRNLYESRSCAPGTRKKRQAANEAQTSKGETIGNFVEVVYIRIPGHKTKVMDTDDEECSMSTSVMAGLIAMAAVICALLIICFIVGMRMLFHRNELKNGPPAYGK